MLITIYNLNVKTNRNNYYIDLDGRSNIPNQKPITVCKEHDIVLY